MTEKEKSRCFSASGWCARRESRRRKVCLTPFPPCGKNCVRFLAAPLPAKASAFAGVPLQTASQPYLTNKKYGHPDWDVRIFGARGGSRTRTPLRALAPEASESTNSTTRASGLVFRGTKRILPRLVSFVNREFYKRAIYSAPHILFMGVPLISWA